jgi:hypothetical protein
MARSSRRQPEPEPSDDHGPEDAPAEGLEGFLQANLAKTPWWIISVVFHAVVLGLLATITFAHQAVFAEESTIIILTPRDQAEKLPDPELRRDLFDRPAVDDSDPNDEPVIVDPMSLVGDHNESADDEDFHERKGESLEFSGVFGESPGLKGRQTAGPSRTDAMGAGGGGGAQGRYGRDRGGRVNMVKKFGGGGTESSVTAGLRWLARHQGDKGGWSCDGFSAMCRGGKCSGGGHDQFDVGVTGLALLAFLGNGTTHTSRLSYMDPISGQRVTPGKVVKAGLDWLISRQDSDGCIGARSGEHMYNHAIGALALAEAYGLSTAAVYKQPAQKAIDFLVEAQNPGLGWRYTARPGANDTSVTGWAVMALKSAYISGLTVPRGAFDGARAWIDRVTDSSDGSVGYTGQGVTDVFVEGKNEQWRSRPSMTAIGLLLRIYIDSNQRDPILAKSARLLVSDLPQWDEAKHEVDSYYWYYATLALFQYQDGGGHTYWKQWNEAMKKALVPSQKVRKDGCQDGSWSPEADRWGFAGGRVYVTAVNTMSLEVYYRYKLVFGQQHEKEEKEEKAEGDKK